MATASKERSPALRLTAQERRAMIVDAAMHEFALGAQFKETRRALASACGAPDRLVRYVLAEQAMLTVAAAMDLPEAWS